MSGVTDLGPSTVSRGGPLKTLPSRPATRVRKTRVENTGKRSDRGSGLTSPSTLARFHEKDHCLVVPQDGKQISDEVSRVHTPRGRHKIDERTNQDSVTTTLENLINCPISIKSRSRGKLPSNRVGVGVCCWLSTAVNSNFRHPLNPRTQHLSTLQDTQSRTTHKLQGPSPHGSRR